MCVSAYRCVHVYVCSDTIQGMKVIVQQQKCSSIDSELHGTRGVCMCVHVYLHVYPSWVSQANLQAMEKDPFACVHACTYACLHLCMHVCMCTHRYVHDRRQSAAWSFLRSVDLLSGFLYTSMCAQTQTCSQPCIFWISIGNTWCILHDSDKCCVYAPCRTRAICVWHLCVNA